MLRKLVNDSMKIPIVVNHDSPTREPCGMNSHIYSLSLHLQLEVEQRTQSK